MPAKSRKYVDQETRAIVQRTMAVLRQTYGLDEDNQPLSDRQWYERVGVARTTLRHLIAGDAGASVDTLAIIADQFGFKVWQLLTPDFDPRRPPSIAIDNGSPKFSRRPKALA